MRPPKFLPTAIEEELMPGPCATRPDLCSIRPAGQQAVLANVVRGLPGADGYLLMEDDHRDQREAGR
jgi:hypothetical protein